MIQGLLVLGVLLSTSMVEAQAGVRFQAEKSIFAAVVKEYKAKAIPLASTVNCKVYQQRIPDKRYEGYEISQSYSTVRRLIPATVTAINKYEKFKILKYKVWVSLSVGSTISLQYGPSLFLDSVDLNIFPIGGKTELCLQRTP